MSKFNSNSNENNEAGYGVIIVIVLIFFLFVMVLAGVSSSISASRSQDNLQTRQTEKWEAKSAFAVMRRVLQVRIPEKHRAHLADAQNCLQTQGIGISNLKAFDEQDMPVESSVPVVLAQQDGTTVCNQRDASSYTSLLGNSNAWAQTLLPLWEQEARSFGYTAEKIKVAQLIEQVRRFNSSGDPTYSFGFIIDARGGQHYRVREQGEVLLGNLTTSCGATGRLDIAPLTVAQGSPVTIKVTYSSVSQLNFYRHIGAASEVINAAAVTEQADPQDYSFSYTPESGYSYSVEALSSLDGCFSRSERISVTVTNTTSLCPVIDILTTSPPAVQSGETSTVAWSVSNAAELTLDGTIVPLSGSQPFVIVADRTFTLNARDAANTCPASRQVSVTVLAVPCAQPVVAAFQVSPSSVQPNQSVTITWQIDNLVAGGTVSITLPDGSVQSVGASGSIQVAAPVVDGTYSYSIQAKNPCSGVVTQTAQVQVVTSCINPSVNGFAGTPDTVFVGGNQNILFNWNVSGTVNSQSIDQGIGSVSGTSQSIGQPQVTTTYTYTAVGCGQTAQAQATVTVQQQPPVTPSVGCQLGGYGGVSLVHTYNLPNTSAVIQSFASVEPDGRLRVISCAGGASFGGFVTTSVTVSHPALGNGNGATWHSNGNPRNYGTPVYFNIPNIDLSLLEIRESTQISDGRGGGGSGQCQTSDSATSFTPGNPTSNCTTNRR